MLTKYRDEFKEACLQGKVELRSDKKCQKCGCFGIYHNKWESGLLLAYALAEYCPCCKKMCVDHKTPHSNSHKGRVTLIASVKKKIIEDPNFLRAMKLFGPCPSCGQETYYYDFGRSKFSKPDRIHVCINPECNWSGRYNWLEDGEDIEESHPPMRGGAFGNW